MERHGHTPRRHHQTRFLMQRTLVAVDLWTWPFLEVFVVHKSQDPEAFLQYFEQGNYIMECIPWPFVQ